MSQPSLAVRVRAARAQVALDRKLGRDTPQWVADLAEVDLSNEPSPFAPQRAEAATPDPDLDPVPTPRRPAFALTDLEREVLELVAPGRTSFQVAGIVGMPPEAVLSIINTALKKLDVAPYGAQSPNTLENLRVALARLPERNDPAAQEERPGRVSARPRSTP